MYKSDPIRPSPLEIIVLIICQLCGTYICTDMYQFTLSRISIFDQKLYLWLPEIVTLSDDKTFRRKMQASCGSTYDMFQVCTSTYSVLLVLGSYNITLCMYAEHYGIRTANVSIRICTYLSPYSSRLQDKELRTIIYS